MSSPTTPPSQPESGAPKPNDSISGTRFLGSSADAQRAEWGAKTIVTFSLLACLLILLLVIVFSFQDTLGERVLVTLATPRFDSPLIPPLEFAQQDVDRLRTAPTFELSTETDGPALSNLTTGADFTRLTDVLLPNLPRHDTLIVFVRLHAVGSDDNRLYLLPADADPLAPERGLEASHLLRAVANADCRNKLVLIDVGQTPRRLRLGWFGENLRAQLTSAYDAAVDGLTQPNMVMICAQMDGRSPVSSAAVQQSIFGGLAAYCLHGGSEVDGAGNRKRDGVLTSGEIAAYLEQAAGTWSRSGTTTVAVTEATDGAAAEPATESAAADDTATDFPVAGVDEFLSVDRFFADREPLSLAGEAENERRRQASQQSSGGGAASGDSGSNSESGLVPTTDVVMNRLRESWRRRESLAVSMAPFRRPRHWSLYHQELRRAESLLLAGKVVESESVLNLDVAPLEQELDAPPPPVIRYPWSLAYRDLMDDAEQTSRWSSILQSAAQTPTRQNLERLRGAPFVEIEVARRAADSMVADPTGPEPSWTEPKLLARAIEIRTLAEQVARFQRLPAVAAAPAAGPVPVQPLPELLVVARDRLMAVDKLRNAAEQDLYVGRTEVAEAQFDLAAAEYLKVQVKCDQLQQQLASFHRMLVEIVSYCEWLAGTSSESAWRLSVEGRLEALLRGTVEFRHNPSAEQLSILAALCDDLRGSALSTVREAFAARDAGGMYAALELPFLDAGLREDLLWALVRRSDTPLSVPAGLRSARAFEWDAGQTPYPVSELADALDANLKGTITGGAFRAMLASQLSRDPSGAAPGQTGYEQFTSHLVRAPFQTALLRLTRFQPTATNEIVARMTMDHLEWQLSRLSVARAANAVDVSGPRSVILRNLREADPAFEESRGRLQQAFSAALQKVAAGESQGQLTLSVSLASLMPLTEADDPHFVVDWYVARNECQVVALGNAVTPDARIKAGESPDQWRISIPVLELARNGTAQVQIELALRSTEAKAPLALGGELAGWITLADGSRYWLPIPLDTAVLPRQPLDIVVTGPDQSPLPDVIRMYPNQRLPVQIQVRGPLSGAEPPRLVVTSGGLEHACDTRATADSQWSTVPAAFDLPVVGAKLVAQAVSGSQVVGARTLTIDVMNPRTIMAADVTYKADTRTIAARIRRVAAATVPAAIAVQLGVSGADIEGGILEGELQPDAGEIALEAVLAAGSPATAYYVSVGACGVPGMFQYTIDPVTSLVERSTRTRIEVEQPLEGATYAAALERAAALTVNLSADADGPGQVNVGFDRDGDGYLQASERLDSHATWSGKGVTTRFVATADPAELAIDSRVSNIVSTIPTAGLVGPQQLLAQLVAGGQFPTATRTIHFLQAAPLVEFASPRQNDAVVFGEPFVVKLTSSDLSQRAIEQIEVAVDLNNNGTWDDGEVLAPLDVAEQTSASLGTADSWTRSYDSRKLLTKEEQDSGDKAATPPPPATKTKSKDAAAEPKAEAVPAGLPRRLTLMARAITPVQDLADPATPVRKEASAIVKRAIRLVAEGKKPTGQIAGHVVTVDGVKQRDVEIVLGELVTKTDDKGAFLIREVPPGTHVVKAARGLRTGQVEVQVSGGQTTSGVEISITR